MALPANRLKTHPEIVNSSSKSLRLENVYKIFGAAPQDALQLAQEGIGKDEIFRRTNSVVAVNNISFTADEAEIFVVMGLSGSGKSTLIRCINRLLEPNSGKIILGDVDVTAANREQLRQIRLRQMAMVFQHFALLPHKTVAENAAYGLKTRGIGKSERRERGVEALKTVGLDAWADAYPGKLSGGMQQRVGLARALAVDPKILLMDEPFSALDPLIRRDMQDELIRIQERLQTTIIFITHDLQEALKLGDKIAIMRDGRFVQLGTPEQIVTEPADDYVLEFTRDVDRSRVLTFRSIMEDAVTVPASIPVAKLKSLFQSQPKLSVVFVTDDAVAPLGVIRRTAAASAKDGDQASQIMTTNFLKIRANKYIHNAFEAIRSANMIAVTDRAGRLVGTLDPIAVFAHLQSPEKIAAPMADSRLSERV
jgi:glycine betaine/proline transport system ATP-binding protein